MRTRMAVVAATVLVALGMFGAVPAEAGGGCHTGATQGTGVTVKLEGACFMPTVLRVPNGTTVTFTNVDTFDHVMSGVGMEYTELAVGASVKQTFNSAGVYPYMCHIHPGMSGAVVVGDGQGTAQLVDVRPVTTLAPAPLVTQPAAQRSGGDRTSPIVFLVIALLAAAAGFAGATLIKWAPRDAAG